MLASLAAAAGLGALAFTALLWWNQERIVFQPPPFVRAGGVADGRIDYTASDGQALFGYVVGDPGSAAGVLVAFHGNADLAERLRPWAGEVHRRTGWAVLLAEYRGYAGLGGRPTARTARLDARAAYDAATTVLGVDPRRIALYGQSLGTPIAVELAAELAAGGTHVHAILLESPFTSARAMARRIGAHAALPFWRAISRFHWDTESAVRAMPVTVAVAHGERDGVVPLHMGQRVHAAARVPGPLLVVRGAGHNDVAWHAGDDYWHWMQRGLDRAGPLD